MFGLVGLLLGALLLVFLLSLGFKLVGFLLALVLLPLKLLFALGGLLLGLLFGVLMLPLVLLVLAAVFGGLLLGGLGLLGLLI